MNTLIILASGYQTEDASPAAKIIIAIIVIGVLAALYPKNHDGK